MFYYFPNHKEVIILQNDVIHLFFKISICFMVIFLILMFLSVTISLLKMDLNSDEK